VKISATSAAFLFLCSIPTFAQQPTITAGGVVNAASFLPNGVPGAGIAQGAIFSITGTNLGSTPMTQASYPLTTNLAGTSVQVTVNGTPVDTLIISAVNTQVTALLPSTTPTGTGTVTVSYNGQASATAPIVVVPSAFGIYTVDQQGDGPATVTQSDGQTPVTLTAPATPGQALILTGTGLGAYNGDETNPPVGVDLSSTVTLWVGNQQAAVSYAGRSVANPQAGVDEIDFTVPAGVNGCYVPIAVVVNGIVSNFASTSVSPDGSTCSDPAGLPSTAINQVAAGGNLRVGFIELQRIAFNATVPILGSVNIKQDRGAAYFYNFDNNALLASRGISSISSYSSCTVLVCTGNSCIPDNSALSVPRLDAGPSIGITGPSGSATLPVSTNVGEYHGPLGPSGLTGSNFLNPGAYTATGSGGADVGAFTANLTVPALLKWTNQSSFTGSIDRSQNLTITWSGGADPDYVAIFGSSTSSTTPQVTATFVCTEKASAGTFSVPSYVLEALPASGNISESGVSLPGGFLLVGNYPLSNTFTAPGLDVGYFTHTVVNGINIGYK
jgi:uncharacterized protein (TIGR03437 family)